MKNNTIKAIFFDFGGTLIDSDSDKVAHFHMMETLKQHFQLSVSAKELVNLYHAQLFNQDMTLRDKDAQNSFTPLRLDSEKAFRSILNQFGVSIYPSDLKWLNQNHLMNHIKYIQLFAETKSVLSFIQQKNIHCGIISDIDREYQVKQFQALQLNSFFHSITTSEEVQNYKPHSKVFKTALNKAGCKGQEAIMVGDSYPKDIIGGKKLGMLTVWLKRYTLPQLHPKEKECADYTIPELGELIPILQGYDYNDE